MVLLFLGFYALFFRFVAGVIVDDSSELIVYSNNPGWEAGSASQATTSIPSPGSSYGGTWHQSLYPQASFTLTFTGTSVAVYGIVPKFQPTLIGFTVDGGAETRFSAPATASAPVPRVETDFNYGVQVFSNGDLSAASHTIVMTCLLQSCVFGLDYVEYTAASVVMTPGTTGAQSSSSTISSTNTQTTGITTSGVTSLSNTNSLPPLSMSTGNPRTIDGMPTIFPSDPGIFYTPQKWAGNTSCGLTSMVTTVSGSSLSFNFTGPSIWIYTATVPLGGKYGISINGIDMGVINTAGPTCKAEALYHIGNLDNSMHTLVVTATSGEIDFLGLRLASSVDQVNDSTSQGAPNAAAIVGGVIGGAALVALLIFGIYVCLRRQRRNDIPRPEKRIDEQAPPVILPDEPYVVPLSEKHQLIAAEREKQRVAALVTLRQREPSNPIIVYQSYRKPVNPRIAHSPSYEGHRETENASTSYFAGNSTQHEQGLVVTRSSAPPSFRTRPVTAQYQYRPAADEEHSFAPRKISVIAPEDKLRPLRHSVEDAGDSQASSTPAHQPWPASAAPPYVDEVLARPDARNLSESDVDMIVRRLAEVMRVQNTARGGPGLLRERTAPPRDLLDRLVGEHLSAREDTD